MRLFATKNYVERVVSFYSALLKMNSIALRCCRLKFPFGGTSFAARAEREIEGKTVLVG